MDEDDAALALLIAAKEAAWRTERALEGLGRLFPRRAGVRPDQAALDDLMRDDFGSARFRPPRRSTPGKSKRSHAPPIAA
jgi:hypothetical protein